MADMCRVFERIVDNQDYPEAWPDVPGLLRMWDEQRGRCAVSGLRMRTNAVPDPLFVSVADVGGKPALVCLVISQIVGDGIAVEHIKTLLEEHFSDRVSRGGYTKTLDAIDL